jgi:SAM-dependent methyltransferase
MAIRAKALLRKSLRSIYYQLRINEVLVDESCPRRTLRGDRAIEWSWVIRHLPHDPASVLDVGCVQSTLSATAARLGHEVTAVDLREIEYELDNVRFLRADIRELSLPVGSFSVIMNSSTIEHVGLAGRYGSCDDPDGDLRGMRNLRTLLSPHGRMILTIPVGCDAIYAPLHRIYGQERLPQLMAGFRIAEQEYYLKDEEDRWTLCSAERALTEVGSEEYYGLGLFVLERDSERPA